MPDRLRTEPGLIPPHLTFGGLEWVRIGVLLLVCALVAVLWAQTSALRDTANRIIDNQNQGSALLCQNALKIGVKPLPARCSDPDVLRYYDAGK